MSKSKENQPPIPRRRIVILGGGESGVGAAILAQKQGFEIFLSDKGTLPDKNKNELKKYGIPYEECGHTIDKIVNADEVIKSPGIPDKVALIKQLRQQGTPVISEIEFASRYTNATIIAITGSNGKTTTTTLTHHLIKSAGLNVEVGGNIGYSFARLVAETNPDIYVLELSSFQLDGITDFRPNVALLLNITPDHLDRYDYKMENYIASKFRIFMNQKSADLAIFNGDDENIYNYLKHKPLNSKGKSVYFEKGENESLQIGRSKFDLTDFKLKGIHNTFNLTCAILAAKRVGVKTDQIRKAIQTFQAIKHRMEEVAKINGVTYINDSKATNVDSVFYALSAMTEPTIWIAGGTDKGNDYEPLKKLVKEKVKTIICLGVDNTKIISFFKDICPNIIETNSAKAAVAEAKKVSKPGDTILLSPACASFDLFKNYIHRGDLFREAVMELK